MAFRLPGSLLLFAREVLQDHGALVEERGEALEVLLPRELRTALDLNEELLVIEPGPGSPERAAARQTGSSLLGGLVRLAQGEGRLAALTLPSVQRMPPGLQREVTEVFSTPGASAKAERLLPGHARYLLLTFLHEGRGQERGSGVTPVLLAEETGLEPPGLLQATSAWDLPWQEPKEPPSPPAPARLDELYAGAARLAMRKAERKIAEHTEQTGRWLTELDHQIALYSGELSEETSTTIARRKLSGEEIERRQQRLEESQAALGRLRENLQRSWTVVLSLALLGGLRLDLPVLRSSCTVQRGKSERTLSLVWSGLTQSWEPLACESCGAATFTIGLCPGPAHLLCADCHERVVQEGRKACGRCRPAGG